jgi:hypothetical protein
MGNEAPMGGTVDVMQYQGQAARGERIAWNPDAY